MVTLATAAESLIDEIAELVEPFRAKRARPARFTFVDRGAGYEIYRNDRAGAVLALRGASGELDQTKLPRNVGAQPVELRLDASRVLTKALQLPAASRQYLDAIVGHQVERMTPWAADRVVFDYVVDEAASTSEQVAVRLVATSRDVLDAAVERLAAAGIRPSLIGTSDDPLDRPSPVNLLQGSRGERRQAFRRTLRHVLMGIAAAALLLSLLSGWRLYSLSAEAAAIQTEMDRARAAVEVARSQTIDSETYAKLVARKRGVVPMVVLLEELSKVIPAGTYLTELQVQEGGVRITGISDNAPALIELMESAGGLSGVHFTAPTTRDDSTAQDRFEIVAKIHQPGEPTQ